MIKVNGRFIHNRITGVEKYAHEVTSRLKNTSLICPENKLSGIKGHMWEQLFLPYYAKDSILWSPCNTGPITFKKHIVTIHDISPIDHPEWMNNLYVSWYRYLIPKLIKSSIKIITDSNFSKSRILSVVKINEDKVKVIPLAANRKFKVINYDKILSTLNKYFLSKYRYILSVSSIEPRKNIARLIKSWNKIEDKLDDDIRLILVGPVGPKRIFKQPHTNNYSDKIIFTGYLPEEDLIHIYNGAMAFIYPSLYEGFGLPPLEAMQCGTPVITSEIPSISEVVGDSCITVNPFRINEISDAIISICNDYKLRKELSIKGLHRSKIFTWERTSQEILNTIKNTY